LLRGVRQIFVVPDGGLESFPMHALVTGGPQTAPVRLADHRDIAWLGRRYAFTVLPSVGSLSALRQSGGAVGAPLPFVGIGAPILSGPPKGSDDKPPPPRQGLPSVDEIRSLDPLPETKDELEALAKAMRAGKDNLYLAERASEPQLRSAGLERYRMVAFATHGLMSGQLGMTEPALVLTPPRVASPDDTGLLTASKVATLKLNADWVILSACNTAASDGTVDAVGLSGLAKAFFYAGARSLLVTHWSIPSQATVKVITGTLKALTDEPQIGRAEALRRAQLAMLDPDNPPEFSHPMFWAAFIVAGEGGSGR
jgi:CHAT domain-containing protein